MAMRQKRRQPNHRIHRRSIDHRGAGFAREVPTGMPDIGAYERQLNDDEIFGNGFD